MTEKVPLLSANFQSAVAWEVGDESYKLYSSPDFKAEQKINTGIACIFSVAFDNKVGNAVEWSKSPQNLSLDGVEFKAMPSGLHKLESDYVIFRQRNLYGIACFHNLKTASDERGARMRSVGVLCRDYRGLSVHYGFLFKAVQSINENPGNYSSLEQYLAANQDAGGAPDSLSVSLFKPHQDVFVDEVSANVSSLLSMMNYFGNSMLILWKAMLLKKRILFYSDVPIGVVCARVHGCGHLLSGNVEVLKFIETPKRLYYVNLNDSVMLEKTNYYVACTTEKVVYDPGFPANML
jgi:hypothetical protein